MPDKILVMMEERRNPKDTPRYNPLDEEIKKGMTFFICLSE